MLKKKNAAIVLAGGRGERFGGKTPKQFTMLGNKPLFMHCVHTLAACPEIYGIVIVTGREWLLKTVKLAGIYRAKKLISVVSGGSTRTESAWAGLRALEKDPPENVLIHDAARPFLKRKTVSSCINALAKHTSIIPAVPCAETIIETKNMFIRKIPDRKNLCAVQTPQAFSYRLIKKIHELAREKKINATDDAGLVRTLSRSRVYVIDGDPGNIKITYQQDIKNHS
ncbi:MAG TPA: 2-C-methyl-D-erythritol 4-phosphate cytidylyltransferase [Spirochaetia bacterium]|nr:2-C-methyl-D-erythritol 4-phosphate cytidylyltransferase [Spirochaetia bacterium]